MVINPKSNKIYEKKNYSNTDVKTVGQFCIRVKHQPESNFTILLVPSETETSPQFQAYITKPIPLYWLV